MDIARDICTDSFYIVDKRWPCNALTAVVRKLHSKAENKSVVCQQYERMAENLAMGLPVERITREVEEEILHMDDELAEDVTENDEHMETNLSGITLEES